MRQLALTWFYPVKKKAAPKVVEQTTADVWAELRAKRKYVNWPTAYGVRAKNGEWLVVYVDRTTAERCWETHPDAHQLLTELDALYGDCPEYPGKVMREK